MIYHFQNITISISVIFLFWGSNASTSYSQFRGNIDLSASHVTNVEGRDTSSPDKIFQPLLELGYDIAPSPFSTLGFSGALSNYFYTTSQDRSYLYASVGATGNFYLSHHDEIAEEAKPRSKESTSLSSQVQKPIDPIKKGESLKAENLKLFDASSFSEQLAALGEHLDSLPIVKGSPKRETSFKDSASVALFALADILDEEDFSESVKSVLMEELSNIRDVLAKAEIPESERKKAISIVNTLSSQFTKTTANSDLLPIPTPVPAQAASEKEVEIPVEKEQDSEVPLVKLISTNQFMYSSYSYTNLDLREDADIMTGKTLATHLSFPLTLQYQKNMNKYKIYSNTNIAVAPHIEIFPTDNTALGAGYRFSLAQFPNDTLFDYSDHTIIGDVRTALTSDLAFFGSVDAGFRNYSHPLRLNDTILVGKRVLRYTSLANYTQFAFTSGVAYFPYERLTLGVFGKITTSPSLDSPTYIISLKNKGTYSGKAADDEYSYTMKGIYLYLSCRLPGDIDIGLDIQRESRNYPNIKLVEKSPNPPKKLQITLLDRTENVTLFALTLSRPFYFTDRFAFVFTSIIPTLSFTSSDVVSTVQGYSYHDFTSLFQLSFGF